MSYDPRLDLYREFLDHIQRNVTGPGIDQVTIADYDQCDKTATHVVCPLYYMDDLIMDELMVQLQQFYAYEYVRFTRDRNGNQCHAVYLATNIVDERPLVRAGPVAKPQRGRVALQPPAAWKAVASAFGLMGVTLFALLKQPLLGWA